MKLEELTAPIETVAPALGLTPAKLKRRCRAMHEATGFPLPLPDLDWRWSTAALASWAEAPGRKPDALTAAMTAANDDGLSDQERAQRAFFARRYGQ